MCLRSIYINTCGFIVLLLLLIDILHYEFGVFHFPFHFDGHLVCLQLLAVGNKDEMYIVVNTRAFSVSSDAVTMLHGVPYQFTAQGTVCKDVDFPAPQ